MLMDQKQAGTSTNGQNQFCTSSRSAPSSRPKNRKHVIATKQNLVTSPLTDQEIPSRCARIPHLVRAGQASRRWPRNRHRSDRFGEKRDEKNSARKMS
jgi:hypothetical protein